MGTGELRGVEDFGHDLKGNYQLPILLEGVCMCGHSHACLRGTGKRQEEGGHTGALTEFPALCRGYAWSPVVGYFVYSNRRIQLNTDLSQEEEPEINEF